MITRKQIEEATSAVPRMRSLPFEQRLKAINYIPDIAKKFGIASEWTNEDIALTTRFIIDHFGNLNARELVLAFELYGAGQIVIPKEKEHFGKLNLTFLGAIFSEYEKIKMQTKAEPPTPAPIERQLPSADNLTIWKADYVFMLNWIKQLGKLPPQGNFTSCFHYLKSSGKIQIEKEQYAEIIATVRGLVNHEADQFQQPEQRNSYRKEFHHHSEAFKNKCREEYFKWWIGQKMSNLDFIEKEIESTNSEFSPV